MVPSNFTQFIDGLTFQVKDKIIPMSRIDDAVRRILRVKFTMALFEDPLADTSLVNQLGSQVCSRSIYWFTWMSRMISDPYSSNLVKLKNRSIEN